VPSWLIFYILAYCITLLNKAKYLVTVPAIVGFFQRPICCGFLIRLTTSSCAKNGQPQNLGQLHVNPNLRVAETPKKPARNARLQ
jgi:hypothetical protein